MYRQQRLSWLGVSILSGCAAMPVTAVALWIPFGWGTAVLVVGVATFILILRLNPRYWYRRLAATVVGTWLTATISSGLDFEASWQDARLVGRINVDWAFHFGSVIIIVTLLVLDYFTTHSYQPLVQGVAPPASSDQDGRTFEREKRSREPSPEEKLALQEKERWAFGLGNLCFLLAVFTHFHRDGVGSSERLEDVRRDTLRHLKRFRELDDSFVKSADGKKIMNAAHDAMGHHVGRVENAFTLGLLIQQFVLRSVEGGTSQEERLKPLARAQRKIWTPDAIFLPENDDLRTAARTIFDYAEKGMYPAKKEAQDLERVVVSCYAP